MTENIQQRVLTHIDGDIYGVAAYYTDNDRIQHAVVATTDGSLYEIHWNRQAPASSPQKLAHLMALFVWLAFSRLMIIIRR